MGWNAYDDVPIPGSIIPFTFDPIDLRASVNYIISRVYDSNEQGVLIPVAFYQDAHIVGLPFRPVGKTYIEVDFE